MIPTVVKENPKDENVWVQMCSHPNGTHWTIIVPNDWNADDVANFMLFHRWPKPKEIKVVS